MTRWSIHRRAIALATLVFIPMSCFEEDCGPSSYECRDDRGCPEGDICVDSAGLCSGVERECVSATPCTMDANCLDGERCVVREAIGATQPFERSVVEHGICGCPEGDTCSPFGGGATSTVASVAAVSSSAEAATSGGAGGDATSAGGAGSAVTIGSGSGAGGAGTGGAGGSGAGGQEGSGGDGPSSASTAGGASTSGGGGAGATSGGGS